MLSWTDARRIDEMIIIADELGVIVPHKGWTKYALTILARLQELADGLSEQYRLDSSLADIMAAKSRETAKANLPDDLTADEIAQGYYFRTVNGNIIKFSSETGLPIDGQPKAMGADDLQEMISNAIATAEAKKTSGTANTSKNVGKYSSPYPMEEISAEGENHPCKGFTERNLRIHKDVRHPEQYADMTDEEYEEHAKKLLMKKCGPDIWGYRCSDGCVCRFNRLTGEYAKGYPGGDIKTCFFPTAPDSDPLDIDLEYARDYYDREKRRDSYDQ